MRGYVLEIAPDLRAFSTVWSRTVALPYRKTCMRLERPTDVRFWPQVQELRGRNPGIFVATARSRIWCHRRHRCDCPNPLVG